MQTKLKVSPFLSIVPSAVEVGTKLKELLDKKEQIVNRLDKALAQGIYDKQLVTSYYLLEKDLQRLRELLLLRSEDTNLGRDYLQYQELLKARLPKGDTYLLEESQKVGVVPYLTKMEPFYEDYVDLLELAARGNVELYVEVFLSNNKVSLVYEYGVFQRAISLEVGREGIDCTQLVLPYLERVGLTTLSQLSQISKSAISGYLYTSIVEDDLTPNMSYTKLDLTPQLISTIRFYASDYIEFGMNFTDRGSESDFLSHLGFTTLPYIRYNLESNQSFEEIIEDWVSLIVDLADISALSTNLRVSVVSHHNARFQEFGFNSIVINPILWSVNPQKAKLQYVHWKQTTTGLKPFAVVSYLETNLIYVIGDNTYRGFYDLVNHCADYDGSILDLGSHVKNLEDLGLEFGDKELIEIPLDSALDILVLGLKPESPVYFWYAPEFDITLVCDNLGRTTDQLLRK